MRTAEGLWIIYLLSGAFIVPGFRMAQGKVVRKVLDGIDEPINLKSTKPASAAQPNAQADAGTSGQRGLP
jgi:hypothetical protein